MRIGFTTLGCDAGRSGIGKYALALLQELPKLAPQHTFVLAVLENEREIYKTDAPNVTTVYLPEKLGGVRQSLLWHATKLSGWAKEQKLDVLFLPAGNRRLPFSAPCPTIGTVHDLSSFHVEAKYDAMRMFYIKRVLPRLIKRLSRVLTVSESSLVDIEKFCGVPRTDIAITPNGYYPEIFNLDCVRDGSVASRLIEGLSGMSRFDAKTDKYWIYVSRIEHPGKNHIKLMEAYEKLYKENPALPHLILAGGDWDGAPAVHARHTESPAKDRIHFVGFVADADLPGLVANAEACIYPSLYEGFGIPVIEAMACGVPVACSNTSSLPEVAGNAAVLFDPSSPDDIAKGIRALGDCREMYIERGLNRAAGFTWRACAEMTLRELEAAKR